jgi:hypothetical protein
MALKAGTVTYVELDEALAKLDTASKADSDDTYKHPLLARIALSQSMRLICDRARAMKDKRSVEVASSDELKKIQKQIGFALGNRTQMDDAVASIESSNESLVDLAKRHKKGGFAAQVDGVSKELSNAAATIAMGKLRFVYNDAIANCKSKLKSGGLNLEDSALAVAALRRKDDGVDKLAMVNAQVGRESTYFYRIGPIIADVLQSLLCPTMELDFKRSLAILALSEADLCSYMDAAAFMEFFQGPYVKQLKVMPFKPLVKFMNELTAEVQSPSKGAQYFKDGAGDISLLAKTIAIHPELPDLTFASLIAGALAGNCDQVSAAKVALVCAGKETALQDAGLTVVLFADAMAQLDALTAKAAETQTCASIALLQKLNQATAATTTALDGVPLYESDSSAFMTQASRPGRLNKMVGLQKKIEQHLQESATQPGCPPADIQEAKKVVQQVKVIVFQFAAETQMAGGSQNSSVVAKLLRTVQSDDLPVGSALVRKLEEFVAAHPAPEHSKKKKKQRP